MLFENQAKPVAGFSCDLLWQDGQLISAQTFEKFTHSLLFHLHNKVGFFPFTWGVMHLKSELSAQKLILQEFWLIMPSGQLLTHHNCAYKPALDLPKFSEERAEDHTIYLVCRRSDDAVTPKQEEQVRYKLWKPELKLYRDMDENWMEAMPVFRIKKHATVQAGAQWVEEPSFVPPFFVVPRVSPLWQRYSQLFAKIKRCIEMFPHSRDLETRMKYQALHYGLSELEPFFAMAERPYQQIGVPPYVLYQTGVRIARFMQSSLGIPRQPEETQLYAYDHHNLAATFDRLCQNIDTFIDRIASFKYREEEFVREERNVFYAEVDPADSYLLVIDNDLYSEDIEDWLSTTKTSFEEDWQNIDAKGSPLGFFWEKCKGVADLPASYKHVYLLKSRDDRFKDNADSVSYGAKSKLIIKGARTPIPRRLTLLYKDKR